MVAERVTSLQKSDDKMEVSGSTGPSKFSLGKIVPLSDVSESMSGTPMMVSIGLGILCSELTNEAFRDLVLTFTDDTKWENLGSCVSFTDKVTKLQRAPWGGSTNFYAAMNRVADVVRKSKLKQDDISNLLVISDMQFNQANGAGVAPQVLNYYYSRAHTPWSTSFEKIKKQFHDLGLEVHGKPLEPPTIIFWNMRGSVGYPAASDDEKESFC